MLSAFTARPIIELRQRDKSRIEAIVTHGDRIFVGLNSGALRVYRLNEYRPSANGDNRDDQQDVSTKSPTEASAPANPSSSGKPTDLLRELDKFSTRAVEQLAMLKDANILVSLSNYHVSLHDLHTFELIETLGRTKNATCFAVTSNIVSDPESGVPEIISRLAVAVKRRLYLWSWHESELSQDVGEVVMAESIRTVTWASATKILCGMNGGYTMIDVVSNEVEDIVSPAHVAGAAQGSRFGAVSSAGMGYMGLGGYTPKPLAAKLADGEMLLAKDVNTLFVNDAGKPLEKRQVPWAAAPESVGYSYPYILALQSPSKGSLEVRNPETLSLLQSISLPGAAQLHFPPPSYSLAHAGKGFHISSDRCVWKMDSTDYDSQIQQLVEREEYDEAISVLNMLEDALLKDKTATMREVKMLKAEMLFKKKRYLNALDLFNDDNVRAPPERVLKLYPPAIAGELGHQLVPAVTEEEDGLAKSTNGPETSSSEAPALPSSPPQVSSFARLLMGGGHAKKPVADTASIASKPDAKEAEDSQSSKDESSSEDGVLRGEDLSNAVRALYSYLVGTRTRLQRIIDPATGKLRPQTDLETGSLDFLKSTQNESEVRREEELRETCRIVDTSLFRAYMFSQPSLASSLFRIPNFCDPEVVNEKLLEHNRYTELVDFFYGKKLHKEALNLLRKFGSAKKPDEAAPALHGPNRTIQYLENLPPSEIDLLLEHAEWVLQANPEYAMEIFTGDTENAETLPRERIVEFLRKVDPKLERQYLEHIVEELEDMTPVLHDRLVELYVSNLRSMGKSTEFHDIMDRFLKFLQKPQPVYGLTKAFELIPRDDAAFYEAQAIVLSNMGQYRQALDLYVFKMKDYQKAEEYCNRVHKQDDLTLASPSNAHETSSEEAETTPSIYHTLLALYLQPPHPHKPNLEPALDLLSKHGSRLPATSTIGLIPDDLPVRSLESYFRGRIRAANSLVNESRIVAGLRKAESISVAARLHLGENMADSQGGRNRHVTITDERHCPACHKKLGGGGRFGAQLVAVLPDNRVVHYACLNRIAGTKAEPIRAPSWGRGF